MKECIGMLLAGGEGRRLSPLTNNIAKPAVPFGGKYRIIDFTLSNCANSNIHTVGVLTQYNPLELHQHIGNRKPWDMDRQDNGITILSPYTAKTGGDWYSGTADAIYQNMHFIEENDPEYVLIISGDHIYQMDYQKLLNEHKVNNADVTISVIEVPWHEAPRFGILNTDENMRIYEFEEKPEKPKNNLASMGIYVFNWDVLKTYLIKDAKQETSSHDFGKDVIPQLLKDGMKLFAYQFNGYWKDVGTIQSYWEANMDLLKEDCGLDLQSSNWRIYTNHTDDPPHFVSSRAIVKKSMINDGSFVYGGEITESILFRNVEVEDSCNIHQSIIHPNVKVGKNSILEKVIVMEGTNIPAGTIIRGNDEEPAVINQEMLNQSYVAMGGEK